MNLPLTSFARLSYFLVVLGLTGCSSVPPASLADWQGIELKAVRLLVNGANVALPTEPSVTLQLAADGKMSGRSAVNRYFGAFSRVTDGTILWQGALGSTRMAGPPAAMKLEADYLRTLASTTELVVGSKVLIFKSANGKDLIEFTRP